MKQAEASHWVENFIEYLGPIPEYSIDPPDSKITVESLQCPDSNEWVVKIKVGPRSILCFNKFECASLLNHFDLIRSLIMSEPGVEVHPSIDRTSDE